MDVMEALADERAAGVITGTDPYRELELYLQKVTEEIGEVFDRLKLETDLASDDVRCNAKVTTTKPCWPKGPWPGDKKSRSYSPEAEDSGLERSSELLDTCNQAERGTQTSPAVSRSSSFTWLSDSSSVTARDSDEDTSTSSGDPESGTGTASPPNTRPSYQGGQKCRRKETWERLRRRESMRQDGTTDCGRVDIWIPRCRTDTKPPPLANSVPGLASSAPGLSTSAPGLSCSAPLLSPSHTPPPSPSPSLNSHIQVHKLRNSSTINSSEIEAGEACKWLRAAGFPQYAQMYEDLQFPIEVSGVEKDHPFLDKDSLQSLFRRLHTLNRCANMKVDTVPKPSAEESDDEDQLALSENWTFQPEIRRWSRVGEVTPQKLQALQAAADAASADSKDTPVIRYGSLPPSALTPDSELLAAKFRRTGSERLRDGAKAFLRRVESLKSRRRKKHHREGIIISGPQVVDVASMEARMRELNCVDVSPPASPASQPRQPRRFLSRPEFDSGALSDSELPSPRPTYYKDANSNHTKVLELTDERLGPGSSQDQSKERLSPSYRGSGAVTPEIFRPRIQKVPEMSSFKENDIESAESSSAIADSDSDTTPKHKPSGVVRWHSFQRASSVRPESYAGRCVSSLSSGQILVLRKLALLKLTSLMERYCPTHRSGWNWELPKFMRKIKTPDYKDKTVFGVPLVVSLQRSGQALPKCIQSALLWLQKNALDQVGLFRKPGVRSRIQKLKMMAEAQPEDLSFEGQQAFDVADMVKQYFRELPEALLTNKLSETFVAIFQYIPADMKSEAVQCALLLLPDEHREALHCLLQFLGSVAAHAPTNQMNASNLAVCLAPSLFHWCTGSPARSASASPRRQTKHQPDPRELGQNKASHDCLLSLIKNHRELFSVCDDLMANCHFSYMEESIPVCLDELGSELQQDWRGYMYACSTALLKEAREKSRGWISVGSWQGVDMGFKKVGDGHPLRLWRLSTDVEAPPTELLHRVLRERHIWDPTLLKWRVVTRLDTTAEIFQYVTASMAPLPAKDYCVLRTWRTELPKGACVIVETSVEHNEGQVLSGGVRGIVLASRYLIEPCGSGKSRIMHLSRIDTKGRTPDWYNKSYGHICALHLSKIRNSFKHTADGPESKV